MTLDAYIFIADCDSLAPYGKRQSEKSRPVVFWEKHYEELQDEKHEPRFQESDTRICQTLKKDSQNNYKGINKAIW